MNNDSSSRKDTADVAVFQIGERYIPFVGSFSTRENPAYKEALTILARRFKQIPYEVCFLNNIPYSRIKDISLIARNHKGSKEELEEKLKDFNK